MGGSAVIEYNSTTPSAILNSSINRKLLLSKLNFGLSLNKCYAYCCSVRGKYILKKLHIDYRENKPKTPQCVRERSLDKLYVCVCFISN